MSISPFKLVHHFRPETYLADSSACVRACLVGETDTVVVNGNSVVVHCSLRKGWSIKVVPQLVMAMAISYKWLFLWDKKHSINGVTC